MKHHTFFTPLLTRRLALEGLGLFVFAAHVMHAAG
jgi:hypothetical protein